MAATKLDNGRRNARQSLGGAMVIRARGAEFLVRACDLSDSGLGFIVRGVTLRVNELVEADVLVGGSLRTLRGVVLYVTPLDPGSARVGIRLAGDTRGGNAVDLPDSASGDWDGVWDTDEVSVEFSSSAARRGRRSAERRKVRLQAHVEPGRHAGVLEDISETGAFVWSPLLMLPGQELRLAVRFAKGVRQLGAVVKWIRRPQGAGVFATRTGMGVKFAEPLGGMDRLLQS